MKKNHPFSQLELLFWNFTISLLSQPGLTRSCVQKAGVVSRKAPVTGLGLLLAFAGAAGLVSGYLFYFVSTSLR